MVSENLMGALGREALGKGIMRKILPVLKVFKRIRLRAAGEMERRTKAGREDWKYAFFFPYRGIFRIRRRKKREGHSRGLGSH